MAQMRAPKGTQTMYALWTCAPTDKHMCIVQHDADVEKPNWTRASSVTRAYRGGPNLMDRARQEVSTFGQSVQTKIYGPRKGSIWNRNSRNPWNIITWNTAHSMAQMRAPKGTQAMYQLWTCTPTQRIGHPCRMSQGLNQREGAYEVDQPKQTHKHGLPSLETDMY